MTLTHPKLLYAKAALLLLTGLLAAAAILIEWPSLRLAVLLAIAIWAFARTYYFVFYVIQHYADPAYRFAGLLDFARYLLRRRSTPAIAPATKARPEGSGTGENLTR